MGQDQDQPPGRKGASRVVRNMVSIYPKRDETIEIVLPDGYELDGESVTLEISLLGGEFEVCVWKWDYPDEERATGTTIFRGTPQQAWNSGV